MMIRCTWLSLAFVACAKASAAAPGLANPASVLCEKNGAKVEIETEPNGSQKGVCVFPDGTRIDEWRYFRNKTRTPK